MNLKLTRTAFKPSGIYGEIESAEDGKKLFFSLEHSYPLPDGSFAPKVPPGKYNCVRGEHQLHNGLRFETFMLMNVPGHDGILIHIGNYQNSSEGCILIGKEPITCGIGKSGDAFREFIQLQSKCDDFTLEVV